MFGFAGRPGRIAFRPDQDVLYFGPRNGYMASEAQFRTVLSLADPAELARVRTVAVSEALFSVDDHHEYVSAVAASLNVEALRQIRQHLPGLRELMFVPRDANGVDTVLSCPQSVTGQLSRQIEVAIDAVSAEFPGWDPPKWHVMALKPDHRPVPRTHPTTASERTYDQRMHEHIQVWAPYQPPASYALSYLNEPASLDPPDKARIYADAVLREFVLHLEDLARQRQAMVGCAT
jgi:hypothetical protein